MPSVRPNQEIVLNQINIPHHVAIFMDRNRSWARQNDFSIKDGKKLDLILAINYGSGDEINLIIKNSQ